MTYAIDNNDMANTVYLEWTSTQPTQNGIYWAWSEGERPFIVEFDTFFPDRARVIAYEGGCEVSTIEKWLGPLPVPEPPE